MKPVIDMGRREQCRQCLPSPLLFSDSVSDLGNKIMRVLIKFAGERMLGGMANILGAELEFRWILMNWDISLGKDKI